MATRQEYIQLFGEDFASTLDAIDNMPKELNAIVTSVLDGMVFDVDIFATNINKTISTMAARGIDTTTILNTLKDDMDVGGRIFGQLKNSTKNSVVQGISDSAKLGQFQNYDMKQTFRWVTVAGHKICIDCKGRAGEEATFEEWEKRGLPGSGWSVCREYCYCMLDPTGNAPKELQGVDVREKGAGTVKKPNLSMAGKHTTLKDATTFLNTNLKNVDLDFTNFTLDEINIISPKLIQLDNLTKKKVKIQKTGKSIKSENGLGDVSGEYNSKTGTIQLNNSAFEKVSDYDTYNEKLNFYKNRRTEYLELLNETTDIDDIEFYKKRLSTTEKDIDFWENWINDRKNVSTKNGNLSDVLMHEFGHHLDTDGILWEIAEELGIDSYNSGFYVSDYAMVNSREYVAESFLSYMGGENVIAPNLKLIFDKLVKGN